MSHRTDIARSAAAGLRAFAPSLAQNPVTIGFDGFVDSIIEVVDKRTSPEKYEPVRTIEQFGKKILGAAGQSSNYELIIKLEKLGGNGPIMANAMASIGFPTTYIGSLGYPALHHVFGPMAKIAECISFCDPGFTDALEFDDGKLMLGKHGSLKDVNAEQLKKVVGDAKLIATLDRSRFLGMVNWTMLTKMDGIWQYLIKSVFPKLSKPSGAGGGGRRVIFIDLADPEKRTRADLVAALKRCTEFQDHADVTLGYNLKEAVQVAEALGVTVSDKPEAEIEEMAAAILQKTKVKCVVIHPRGGAAAAMSGGASAKFAGPFVARPKLSTGAGDNFNAGFCLGVIAGLPVEQALCVGTGTSGYYVRNAASPTIAQLADFCDNLPAPEPTA